MFDRDLLPDPTAYFDTEGLSLLGSGAWRTTSCPFHGGSDSLRVNVNSGAWCCMNCGAKGGDVLAFHMRRHGLEFVEAARALGACSNRWGRSRDDKPRTLSPRAAMELVAFELTVLWIVISDIRGGQIPSDADWTRFVQGVGRIEALASEYSA
jgi:hypothetical protein